MRDWTPREQGGIYCAPACGHGCTKAEHQRAVDGANKLCALLGTNWTPRVWENLGWHYTAKLEKAAGVYIEVYPPHGGNQYWVDSRLPEQFHINCDDPKEGIKAILEEAQQAAIRTLAAVGLFDETPTDPERVLGRVDRLFKEALPKFNWGASALDANAIQLLNEVPGEVAKAMKALKGAA